MLSGEPSERSLRALQRANEARKNINTSGLTPRQARLKRQLEGLTPHAISRIGELIGSTNEQVALGACREVLDRNLGKARQVTEITGSVQHTADAHIQALVGLARQAREQRGELSNDSNALPVIEARVISDSEGADE